MNKELIESTLTSFLKAWEEKNIEAVVNLLSDSFEYYETPLDKPLTEADKVRDLWAPVAKFEAKISLSFETISVENDFGIFRIHGIYEEINKITNIDRIFLLAVDENGKITKFIQWRESKIN